jgi:glycosyltransferase involved in cell wall biosynthesis
VRLAIATRFRQVVGGIEVYLKNIIPELSALGFEIGLWHEVKAPEGLELIPLPAGATECCVAEVGRASAADSLSKWRPDLIFSHGAIDLEWESTVTAIAPVVFFCHDYRGTCISGHKAWKFSQPRPCGRRFGWECLAHYFPHRCGGLNPITMVQEYSVQSRRLKILRRCAAIATASQHMRAEYLNHGFDPGRVVVTGLYIPKRRMALEPERPIAQSKGWRLLFCGRMSWLKGGQLLLEAAPIATKRLDCHLTITFLGDGAERAAWRRWATELQVHDPNLQFEFTTWLPQEDCESVYRQTDLLVVPSVWPEPFGLIGPEAAQYGAPAVAFAAGGIADWLTDGVNGHLAPCDPPTAAGLAEAIVKSLSDLAHYRTLKAGALQLADRFSLKRHLAALLPVFDSVTSRSATGVTNPGARSSPD